MSDDGRSFADMLASTRRQETGRKASADDLPRVSRSFASIRDQDCASGYAGGSCDGEIYEGDEAAFVDDDIACQACFTAAQETRDDFFDR
jgi:hypothetical protein